MGDLANLPTAIGTILAWTLGAYLKAHPDVKNSLIPWVNGAIAVLSQVAAMITGASPLHAATFGVFVAAIPTWLGVIKFIFDTIVQTFFITGGHSFVKNGIKEAGQ